MAACLFALFGATAPAQARSPEVRSASASRPAAVPARRPATTAARASSPHAARSTTARRAHASRAPHRRASVLAHADGTRLRDSPQELIPVLGPDLRSGAEEMTPRAACLAATRRAEDVHGLPRGLLTAVALAESGLHAYALSIGGRAHFPETQEAARHLVAAAPSGRSIMAGCVQVNARVHARNSHWPLDPMVSADWAGGMMARWAAETGSWSEALRRWHGGSPASTRRLACRVRAKMEVTSPGSTIFDQFDCNSAEANRTRHNGAIHLATAQRQSR